MKLFVLITLGTLVVLINGKIYKNIYLSVRMQTVSCLVTVSAFSEKYHFKLCTFYVKHQNKLFGSSARCSLIFFLTFLGTTDIQEFQMN